MPDHSEMYGPGKVQRMDQKVKEEAVYQIRHYLMLCDSKAIQEIVGEFELDELCYLWREFNSAERGTIKLMLED